MFVSFFPRPRLFLISVIVWTMMVVALWFLGARNWGASIGLPQPPLGQAPIVGVSIFWSPAFLWFYLYYLAAVGLFALFWRLYAPHPWSRWSIWGSALILFVTYLQVQVSVAINAWYGPFYDLIQAALAGTGHVTSTQFYLQLLTFAESTAAIWACRSSR